MRVRLVVGNWKMHGGLRQNEALLTEITTRWRVSAERRIGVCVPFPYLGQAQNLLARTSIAWGAQNVSQHDSGAHTGEVAATMLKDFACSYVIVGHSERRHGFNEEDAVVAQKCVRVLENEMTAIYCVGETLAERQSGVTSQVVLRQLRALIERVGSTVEKVIIAYEPVWAIGTGETASPQQAQDVHRLIREVIAPLTAVRVPILYGGSVKPSNARDLFAMPDIDGGLIGGASLKADEFLAICNA